MECETRDGHDYFGDESDTILGASGDSHGAFFDNAATINTQQIRWKDV